jgi:hypothetical protein
MSSSKSNWYVTKLAAAQRQLRAAIRTYFAREDELAIHTVASAAYRLIADLKKHRGRDEAGDYYLTSIFYCVRDYRRGTLPRYLADDAQVMAWIKDIAKALPIACCFAACVLTGRFAASLVVRQLPERPS